MASSDSETPAAPDDETCSAEHEAQRAAANLKGQIAAVRARVETARAHLSGPARAPRSLEH